MPTKESSQPTSATWRPSPRFLPVSFNNDEPVYQPSEGHQNFYQLRQAHLERGTLFEDPDFRASDASIGIPSVRNVQWRRPPEISKQALFFVDGASRFDICQGALNDCWLLTAAANLTTHPWLFRRAIPEDNSFGGGTYAGIFHFRFWEFGQWVEVVIDDRLPTDGDGQLIFGRSNKRNELWSALLEKAYAKFYGSYAALDGGTAREAMQDLTGGLTEFYQPKKMPDKEDQLWDILCSGFEAGSMFACNLKSDPTGENVATKDGLLRGHSYSITKLHELVGLYSEADRVRLLRIRNPWGSGVEWNGRWSDKSREWKTINGAERKHLALTIENDGEFWMDLGDFMKHFDRMEVCHLSPEMHSSEGDADGGTGPDPTESEFQWQLHSLDGQWVRETTAGGSASNLDTFVMNPQYTIHIQESSRRSSVVIALMQKYRRADALHSLTIGFIVYRVTREDLRLKPIPKEFFQQHDHAIVGSSIFINAREVSCRLSLEPGHYLVIPSTFDPGEEGDYLLRIFTERCNTLSENDAILCFGTIDDRITEQSPLFDTPRWPVLADQFYSCADKGEQIDQRALQEILRKQFFCRIDTRPGRRSNDTKPQMSYSPWRKMWSCLLQLCACFWVRPTPSRTNLPVEHGDDNNHERVELLERIAELLMKRTVGGDGSTLGFEHFRTIVRDVYHWEMAFRLYDVDGSGTLDRRELRQALRSSGFNVNNRILCKLLRMVVELNRTHIELIDFALCAAECRNTIDLLHRE
ncbi:calpain-B-like [Anopheles bellator]|uniref:calpain-B-like n=1 Tax=Anopheles bellator TaxID=139047 RepID=UPI0026497CD8|nr:calpain-B-like [Anopheles bellator]